MNDIKQQLLTKIGDTTERTARVQEQVHKNKRKYVKRKVERLTYYTTIIAFLGLLTAASFLLIPSMFNEKQMQPSEEPPEAITPVEEETEIPEGTPLEEEPEIPDGLPLEESLDHTWALRTYFPSNSTSTFNGGYEDSGSTIESKWLNQYYLQQIVENGGAAFEHIFRFKDNKMDLVYREYIENKSTSNMTFEELEALTSIELFLEAPFQEGSQFGYGGLFGEGVILSLDAEITTPLGTFTNVMVVETNADGYRKTSYYAPEYGYIKGISEGWNWETEDYVVNNTEEIIDIAYADQWADKETPEAFEKSTMSNYKPSFHTPWVSSPNGKLQATIEGRGEHAAEENVGTIVVEDLETKQATIFRLLEAEKYVQYTPKNVEWINDRQLFVIVGYAYGTVSAGGKLYVLDIEKNKLQPVITELTPKEEVMAVKVNGDGTFTYKLNVYDSDEYSSLESHIEEGTLPLPEEENS